MDNKLGLGHSLGGHGLGDLELIDNLYSSLENHGNIMKAFFWRSHPRGHAFWANYYEEGGSDGKRELHKMIRKLKFVKPFNKNDWM